jgi:hypothetical protein
MSSTETLAKRPDLPVADFGDHLDPAVGAEDSPDPLAHQRVVVGEQDPNRRRGCPGGALRLNRHG